MSVTIHTCPTCQGLLINDSVECPHCGLILNPERSKTQGQMLREIDLTKGQTEKACPQCGEHVRAGLVRCWKCGGFMNTDIENLYREMQASPSPVIYSISPDELLKQAGGKRPASGKPSDEDGFELDTQLLEVAEEPAAAVPDLTDVVRIAPPIAPGVTDDDSFELASTSTMHFPSLANPSSVIDEGEYQLLPPSSVDIPQTTPPSEPAGDPGQTMNWSAPANVTDPGQTMAWTPPVDPASVIPVPEGWDTEQYFQYLREAWTWHQQLDPSQQAEYAATVQEQTGLPFPPEHIAALFPTEQPAEPEPAAEQPSESAEAAPVASPATAEEQAEHHSIATQGDVLLSAALQEEQESVRKPRAGRSRIVSSSALPPGTFLVYCPQGHRIQVKEKHRGQTGKCPNCKSLFHVPLAPVNAPTDDPSATLSESGVGGGGPPEQIPGYAEALLDQKLHLVQTTKLKLKPGSLAQEYETVDIGIGAPGLLVLTVFKGGGAFRASAEKKKKPQTREAYREHLKSGGAIDDLPTDRAVLIPAADVAQIRVAQPAPPGEDSIFADVPVFGAGMIAVRLPAADGAAKLYLSFTLSEFREFARLLNSVYGVPLLGADLGIPMEDTLTDVKCGFSDTVMSVLNGPLDYHKADPKLKPVVVGRKCAGCGVAICEEARVKQKLGSKSGSGVAKAKCPKCKAKFGDVQLLGLPVPKK